MKQKDFIELTMIQKRMATASALSKELNIPNATVRRIFRELYMEGKLERKIIRPNLSIYRWKINHVLKI